MRTRVAAAVPLLFTLLGAVLLACGGTGAPGAGGAAVDAPGPCPPPDIAMDGAVDIEARCRRILAIADARLGPLHVPITEVEVRWNVCPPGARCRFIQLSQGWVMYRFWVGDPVMIHVTAPVENNMVLDELVAGEPEPLPGWLLEQLGWGGQNSEGG